MVRLQNLNQDNVGGILNGTTTPAVEIRGKLGRGTGYGFARRGDGLYGENTPVGGIYQKRYTGYNQNGYIPGRPRVPYYVRMRKYRPTNPNSPAQQSRRATFAEAVAAWQNMSEAERAPYKKRAVKKSRRGRNLFIQEYMLQSES